MKTVACISLLCTQLKTFGAGQHRPTPWKSPSSVMCAGGGGTAFCPTSVFPTGITFAGSVAPPSPQTSLVPAAAPTRRSTATTTPFRCPTAAATPCFSDKRSSSRTTLSRTAVSALPSADEVVPTTAAEKAASEQQQCSLFIFGVGYVATAIALTYLRKGWTVHGTCTDPRKVKSLEEQGIKAYIFDDWSGPMMQPEPLEALARANCVLSTVPPALQTGTDPVLVAHAAELQWAHSNGNLRWVGYLSSTGVYGDRGGGWVTEEDEPWPAAPRTKARLKAERCWLHLHERHGVPTHVFRLAGIYGPGRSALDAVARHSGDIRLAGSDDGTMVSRIHVSDIVGVLEASVERPEPGMVMNVADDLPSTRYETLAYGCKLLGFPRQDPDPAEKYVNRRGGGNKRVDNGKMRGLLAASGRPLVFPDYRIGLKALHEGDGRPFVEPPALDAQVETAPLLAPRAGGKTTEAGSSSETEATALGAASAVKTSTDVITGNRKQGQNNRIDSEREVAAELKALTAQVSRLEAGLDRVLSILGEKDTRNAVAEEGGAAEEAPNL